MRRALVCKRCQGRRESSSFLGGVAVGVASGTTGSGGSPVIMETPEVATFTLGLM